MYTYKTEFSDILADTLILTKNIVVDEVSTAKDVMINMHIDWENLLTKVRNRKIDGFEPVIKAMEQLAATTLSMAAALRARTLQQREMQMAREAYEEEQREEKSVFKKKRNKKIL